MKLVLVILRDKDFEAVSSALVSGGFRVTRIASTGGFLKRGSSTLLCGVEDEKVEETIHLINQTLPQDTEPGMKRATLFVLNVARFEQV